MQLHLFFWNRNFHRLQNNLLITYCDAARGILMLKLFYDIQIPLTLWNVCPIRPDLYLDVVNQFFFCVRSGAFEY